MVSITFPNSTTERRAIAFMIGRFASRKTRPGVHLVPEEALPALTAQKIPFEIKVKSTAPRPGESPKDVTIAPKHRHRDRHKPADKKNRD